MELSFTATVTQYRPDFVNDGQPDPDKHGVIVHTWDQLLALPWIAPHRARLGVNFRPVTKGEVRQAVLVMERHPEDVGARALAIISHVQRLPGDPPLPVLLETTW